MKQIRHSLLPKLAQCPVFESKPGTSAAAERGTRMDAAFRGMLAGDTAAFNALPEDEQDAVEWACNEVLRISGLSEEWPKARDLVITDEEFLKVTTPGIDHIGTMDCHIPSKQLIFDLKSGQIRSYKEQAAAYCYGIMEREFADSYEAIMVFCDQRESVHYKFSFQEAQSIVEEVLESVANPDKQPSKCEYCSWCAFKDTCPQIVQPTVEIRQIATKSETLSLDVIKAEIGASTESLSDFYRKAKIFQDELIDWAKESIKAKLDANEVVPGWKLSKAKKGDFYTPQVLEEIFSKMNLTTLSIIEVMGGTLPAADIKKIADKLGVDLSEFMSMEGKEYTRMIEDKPKKVRKK